MTDFGHGRNRRSPSMAPDTPRARRPMQLEWENLTLQGLLASIGLMRVDYGRGTPRDPGRARLIATQQVTAADLANSGPHS